MNDEDHRDDDDDDDDAALGDDLPSATVGELVMCAVPGAGKRTGFAFFDCGRGELRYGDNNCDTAPMYPTTAALKFQLRPTVIVAPSKAPLSFLDALGRPNSQTIAVGGESEGYGDDVPRPSLPPSPSVEVVVLPSREFDGGRVAEGLLGFDLRCLRCGRDSAIPVSIAARANELRGILSNCSTEAMRAIAGLVYYLAKGGGAVSGNGTFAVNGRTLPPINSISTLAVLGDCMHVDEASLDSLGVFRTERHPILTSKGRPKEGLSLFGVLDRCVSMEGRRVLRRWLSAPLLSPSEISARHDAVEFLSAPENSEALGALRSCLRKTADLSRVSAAFQQLRAGLREWERLSSSLRSVDEAKAVVSRLPRGIAAFDAFRTALSSRGATVAAALIESVFDAPESREQMRVCVLPGIDAALDTLKATYGALGGTLDRLARVETDRAASLGIFIESLNAVYAPQMGFLVAVPCEESSDPGSMAPLPVLHGGFEFRFRTLRAAFYKTAGCAELDRSIGDVHTAVCDAEAEVVRKVAERISSSSAAALIAIGDSAAEVDVLCSFAVCALDGSWARPHLDAPLSVRGARHPLLELCCAGSFVGYDFSLVRNGRRTLVVTAPNSSGKTAFMGTIGLLQVMAQCGSFVPASGATLPVVDRLFCRATHRDSASSRQSSFVAECSQVAVALSTPLSGRSLVLLDEFGKGTDPGDGSALLAATLFHLASLPDEGRPMAVVVTHFPEAIDLVRERMGDTDFAERVAAVTMECRVPDDVRGEVVFLFRPREGISRDSLAFRCARASGFPEDVVARAESVARMFEEGCGVTLPDDATARRLRDDAGRHARIAEAFRGFAVETGNLDELRHMTQ